MLPLRRNEFRVLSTSCPEFSSTLICGIYVLILNYWSEIWQHWNFMWQIYLYTFKDTEKWTEVAITENVYVTVSLQHLGCTIVLFLGSYSVLTKMKTNLQPFLYYYKVVVVYMGTMCEICQAYILSKLYLNSVTVHFLHFFIKLTFSAKLPTLTLVLLP